VVHLAWLFQPTHDPMTTWRANVIGSSRLFEAAAGARVPTLVHASSIGAYSPAPGRVVDESWPTHSLPSAGYGREKAYVERLLDTVEARHPEMRVVRLRPGFIFKAAAATAQRRLFLGPLFPGSLARPGLLPVVPLPRELRFQALHTEDAAEAYLLAVRSDVRGAFNLAAEPVLDGPTLAAVLEARFVPVPSVLVRSALAAAWHAHLLPADPKLFDLVLGLPLLDTTRARTLLGWTPTRSGADALSEMLHGLAEGAGGSTPPLAGDSPAGRLHEISTGVGEQP
ncbi:MAG: NAD-dependent epimerase/dehydratase family protein, partial [Actinomycetota bacterium]|nr:NAD-dependent epimerase/dehydratase family protein [Actinomycetota bacterium]